MLKFYLIISLTQIEQLEVNRKRKRWHINWHVRAEWQKKSFEKINKEKKIK